MENEYLSKMLKFYRKKAGFTQKRLAEELEIKRSAYAYYETGKTAPKLDTLAKIARFYNLPIESFLNDNGGKMALQQKEPELIPDWDIEDSFNQLTNFEQSVICKVRKMSLKEKEDLFNYLNKN